MRRPIDAIGDRLPNGWGDLFMQFGLFLVAYQGYQVVRGLTDGREALAFANAERIIELERSLGLFFEAELQALLLSNASWIIDLANFLYVNTHFAITVGCLAWLYLFRNQHFYFVRNMFMVAMALALVGYAAYPTAPPRMLTEYGFVDTIATMTAFEQDSNAIGLFVNKYAAVPSMHIGFALMIAVPAAAVVRSPAGKVAWALYPVLVLLVIVVTAQHYWLDAAAGAAIAATAAFTAHRLLAPVRPAQWAFNSATA